MDYHEYDLEDFLADPEFRNWVLRPDPASHIFWKKWLAANPSKRKTVLAAKEIILSLKFRSGTNEIGDKDQDELLKSVLGKPNNSIGLKKQKWVTVAFQVAASLVLLIGLSITHKMSTTQEIHPAYKTVKRIVKENLKGQKSRITLPDGSTVFLNNNSRISYASKFGDEREIFLEGEAFFEVKKDPTKPFLVNSRGLITKALGTSFNIKAPLGKKVEVGLVSGKISVASVAQVQEVEIIDDRGGKATFDATQGKLDISSYKDMDFYKWTKRILVFKSASFEEIKETLENWYDVEISVNNLNRRINYTGEFPSESLESVLERMAFVEKFSFEINRGDERSISITFE
ncbi:FecR family protein [Flagellimonas flava]|uniref:FecR family protein n=1 Tax=Flagellimonas flava TaxID=570519 RepID=A0A1M5HYE5_9FLAO|nr:FecR family protein [Allomuricauda flava]SHG21041.1 FecR family protein [Allomuricauda flava]